MANRYNTYQKIDYVGLPVDAYAQAAGSMEQENLMKLQEAKSVYDGMQNVEASYNPDRQLKAELLDDVQKQIAGISNKNLKGNDALLQLGKIVNNRDTIDKLANIYANTVNYKAALASQKKYQEDYGNDINIQPGIDEMDAYNKLDSKGFKAGMMSGYAPGKFLDLVGDAQKLLKDSKGNSYTKTFSNGRWIYKTENEELTEDQLLQKALPLFNDPKYATQLKSLQYYGLKKYGSNPNEALKNYNTNYVTAANEQISDIAAKISEYEKLAKQYPKRGYQKLIEKGKAAIQQLSQERDMASDDPNGEMFNRNLKIGLAKSALSPYTYSKESVTQIADPYGLAKYKSDLAFGNWDKQYKIKKADEEAEKARLEFINRPIPTMHSIKIPAAGGKGDVQTTAMQFTSQGGYNTAAIAETISGALNKGDGLIDLSTTKSPEEFNSLKKTETLKQGIASGKYQVFYVPATKQYMITSGNRRYAVNADQGMQDAMDPLYRLSDPNMQYGVTTINGISLDGKTAGTLFAVKDADHPEPALFAPYTNPINTEGVSDDNWRKMIGMDLSKDQLTNHPGEGVYVAVQGNYETRLSDINSPSPEFTMVEPVRRVFTEKEYKEAVKNGFKVDKAVHYYRNGNNIQFVEPQYGGNAAYKIHQSHMEYQTNLGGQLRNLRNADMLKTKKTTTELMPDEVTDDNEDN